MSEEMLKKNLAGNLIRLREGRAFTQEGLVQALKEEGIEVSRTALASYENERSFPKLDVLYALSRYFNTDIDTLLQEKEEARNVLDKNIVSKLNLDDLLQDFSEVLMYMKMYRNMYYALSESILKKFGTPEHHKDILEIIGGVYANEQLKMPKLQDLFVGKLDIREQLVFQGIHNQMPIQELAKQLCTTPEAITTLFISAKDKVFDLLFEETS